jgi:hypothetical protein
MQWGSQGLTYRLDIAGQARWNGGQFFSGGSRFDGLPQT